MLAICGYSRTRIADLERSAVRPLRDAHAYLAAGWREFDGVVHEIDQRLTQHETVAGAPGSADALDRHRLMLLFSQHAQVRGHVLSQLAKVDPLG